MNERSRLKVSILVVAALGAFAVTGLASEGNWQKSWRVGIAFSIYCIILFVAQRIVKERIPLWPFVLAGALAEITSGWLRTDSTNEIEWAMVAGGILLGLIHWLGLHASNYLRHRLTARS